jgi:pyrroline-5-carboxylate reductase
MAEAMISGLLMKKLVIPSQIVATGPRDKRASELREKYGIRASIDNLKVAESDVIVLAVKPQTMVRIIDELQDRLKATTLLISIAAGISLKTLEQIGVKHLVRAMPNTPGQINQGITVWTSTNGTDRHKKQAAVILGALGQEVYVEEEKYLDMATALSGTGPAYVYLFMEALIDAGIHIGLPRYLAEQLVIDTVSGSSNYAKKVGKHLARLRNDVTSPAGTTAEALFELEQAGMRTALSKAVLSAHKRSIELGKI